VSDIQILLQQLGDARITPMVLDTLDYVVPGEWSNHTSLEAVIEANLGVTDPAEVARIKERAELLYASQPHYSRAVRIFAAADSVDKVAAAAVMANQVGESFQLFGVLNRFTPKPETTQAIDAALKLSAEVVAFALLRGIPVTDLAEAKAFPATLATYARADMMRLAAWMSLDGLLPLGPEFISKIRAVIADVDFSKVTDNALFAQLKGLMPGTSPDEQKGFILSTLEAGSSYVQEFVSARGLTQDGLASAVGGVMDVGDKGLDLLAATVDASTNYFEHTGIQSVARVLVHDAQEALAAGEAAPEGVVVASAESPEETSQGGSWFKNAAAVAVGAAGGIAIGSLLVRGKAEAASPEAGGPDADAEGLDFDDDDDDLDDDAVDDELDGLDDNALEARENALRMKARRLRRRERRLDDREEDMVRRVRRARRRRRRGGGGGGRMGGGRMGGGRGGRGGRR
jgi:hypothetical protein